MISVNLCGGSYHTIIVGKPVALAAKKEWKVFPAKLKGHDIYDPALYPTIYDRGTETSVPGDLSQLIYSADQEVAAKETHQ